MFKSWCHQQGLLNGKRVSHVLMDGGVLSVPFDRLEEFYTKYIQCINSGERLFVVEQKTERYNFFLDIDYNDDEALSLEQVRSISMIICRKVQTFSNSLCTVSVAQPKPKNGLIKTGIHYNWNTLVVEQSDALNLRAHIIESLRAVYSSVDWEKFVDVSVYGDLLKQTKGSGFRLPWSHKRAKHEACQGEGCAGCNQTGKIDEGEYLPVYEFRDDQMKSIDQTISMERLKNVTVRTKRPRNANVPEMFCQPVVSPTRASKREGSFSREQTHDEIQNPEVLALLETFIRQNLRGQEMTRLSKLFKYKNTILIKTTSKFCENVGRSHNGNHVWFLLTENGTLCQKCFCRCDTMKDRKSGFCKDFSGKKHLVGSKIVNELFPNKKIDKIKRNVYLHLSHRYTSGDVFPNI